MKQTIGNDFTRSLLANPSAPQVPDSLKLFEPFIGSWDWVGFDYAPDNTRTPTRGKWLFQVALNGNAIQDIFIFEDQTSFAEYGTTIRFPNDDGKTWQAVWIAPMNKVIRPFTMQVIGDEIVLESKSQNGNLVHWIFSGITANSFHWRGERSSDSGESWRLYEDLDAKRTQPG